MEQEKAAPKVSVCVVTYNQEGYIRKCLQSLVDQETDFDFEVIVGEDCSPDGTRSIVQEFAHSYPNIVKPIFHEQNVGAMKNYLAVHRAALGKYVCHIDGDDWTRPNKLARQHHYLEQHPACSMVAHRMGIWESGDLRALSKINPDPIDLSVLLRKHPMFLHSSIMYRRASIADIFGPDRTFIDFFVYVSAALTGKIGFINEVLGDYRRNIGISSARNLMPYIQAAVDHAEVHGARISDVKRCRSRSYLSYAVAALCQHDMVDFRSHLSSAVRADQFWIYPRLIQLASLMPATLRRLILMYKNRPQAKC